MPTGNIVRYDSVFSSLVLLTNNMNKAIRLLLMALAMLAATQLSTHVPALSHPPAHSPRSNAPAPSAHENRPLNAQQRGGSTVRKTQASAMSESTAKASTDEVVVGLPTAGTVRSIQLSSLLCRCQVVATDLRMRDKLAQHLVVRLICQRLL